MTRPAINPANIRRAHTKTRHTITRWVTGYLTFIAVVVLFVHVFDPALNPFV